MAAYVLFIVFLYSGYGTSMIEAEATFATKAECQSAAADIVQQLDTGLFVEVKTACVKVR